MKITQPNVQVQIKLLGSLSRRLIVAAAKGLQRGLIITAGLVQTGYLSGPRPTKLDVRTGRLRNSIATSVLETSDRITGRIGSNVKYAAFHEFGYRGTVQVKAHTRQVLAEDVDFSGTGIKTSNDELKRRSFKDRQGNFIGFRESRATAGARLGENVLTQQVKAHSRTLNYPGRPFMRPALIRSEQVILGEIRKEMANG